MLCFLLTSFVFTSAPTPAPKPVGKPSSSALVRQQPQVIHVPRNATKIVTVPNGLMEKVQQEFGLTLLFPQLSEDNFAKLQVDLKYKKLPHTDGPAVASVEKQACLNLTKYYELMRQKIGGAEAGSETEVRLKFCAFHDKIKQHISELFELAYRYLHEYRAPKHNLRWWRDGLLYIERAVVGAGQIIGVGLYASSPTGAGGISASVGSALIGLAGELVSNNWRKQEEAYFKMRDEIDGKFSTLLSFYAQSGAEDVLNLFQTIIVDVLGYGDPKIMREKLKKTWPYMQSYFPKDASTTVVDMSSAAVASSNREPTDN